MFRKALIAIGGGRLCHATAQNDGYVVLTRENGRIIRRQLTAGGKVFGARQVGYGEAYFEFPFATVEILGEEITYTDKQGANSSAQA